MKRWRPYRYWSIRAKLLTFSALFVLVSVFVVSGLSYLKYTSDYKQQSANQVQQTIEQVSINVSNYLDDLFRLSLAPYRNNEVMESLEVTYPMDSIDQLYKRRLLEGYLDEIMIYPRRDIVRVFILSDDIYWSGRFPLSLDTSTPFQQYPWFKEALTTKEPIFVPANQQQMVKNDKANVFSIVKQLRSINHTDKILGAIKVDANYEGIRNISEKVDVGKEGSFFIIDEAHNVVYANNQNTELLEEYRNIPVQRDPLFTNAHDGRKILVNFAPVEEVNWTIVAVNSLNELNRKSIQTRNAAFLFAVLCSLLSILILTFFVRRFLRPLLDIVRLMKKVEQGRLDVRFPNPSPDEIGYLGTSFNALVEKVNDMLQENTLLVKEVYEAKLLQQEAQINALQSQIRPHFIFNTLNMISLLMQSNQQEKAVEHIHQLSFLLRSMTNWTKEVTLKREIELLRAYLDIQCSRFEDRLEYSLSIDENLMDALIPPFIFQPVVENAVIHGCEEKRGKTRIQIYSVSSEDKIMFIVEDNGRGMSAAVLRALQVRLQLGDAGNESDPVEDALLPYVQHSRGTGIGLINIDKRLKTKYGPAYGLQVDSTLGRGTTVTIMFPSTLLK
ncbi:histidine kinase [Paenibacillus antibioticophila]|uniref:histidine kinase n=1 Tax=Paenibacillus antibioticophila TaxID=1274374 RepID=A0A919XV72_9BACL|nr:sensor histidine kinase [Paenibacillus antibioticophila]GIO38243.1 histidine kinase [Paenibacillus antibioticophila]